ncbi:hypothetical protein F3Y22_tig00111427pilonHSYRG00033 [Hibiscus syriacus]|uniref:Pectinesterase inhibitor domain-containing protein n=1 Tax=Hibiscus syriacus TaxID=106335 RepID=A0A6A2XP66_HIBSY|nr:pectinesterase inhibitor 9-like [Hibiscus syriacus]KAE8678220.1 hypothetical protein F3Y22_tig00111427pilonHSYRG00026 [Hibiscus syriacus]KAE8678221.1 hypothetical protein F3Y22_tig00111427pilonHSYRG00033 [Hibiscus syriacus]
MATTISNHSLQFLVTLLVLNFFVNLSLVDGQGDPKSSPQYMKANAALKECLLNLESTTASMAKLPKTPAMQDCSEVLGDGVDKIRKSIGEMDTIQSSDFSFKTNNIQTWVSSALTGLTTCSDGLPNDPTKTQVQTVSKKTSNALALINDFAKVQK